MLACTRCTHATVLSRDVRCHCARPRFKITAKDGHKPRTTRPPSTLLELSDELRALYEANPGKAASWYAANLEANNVCATTTGYAWFRCSCCGQDFGSAEQLDAHYVSTPLGCDVHGECFAHDDAVSHAASQYHTRCFINGCHSKYMTLDGWTHEEIQEHIRTAHSGKDKGRRTSRR